MLGQYKGLVTVCMYCAWTDWFQLVGLIHDVGKMMALWDEPQVRGRFYTGETGTIKVAEYKVSHLCLINTFNDYLYRYISTVRPNTF